MRVPTSITNVNIASVASELPVNVDATATGVGESSSPFYLTGGSLYVPLMMWGARAPSHCVRVIRAMPDARTVVTGSAEGQLVVWDVDEEMTDIRARHMLFAHKSSITTISPAGVQPSTSRFVTADESGRICLFDSIDGRCLESADNRYVHTEITVREIRGAGGSNAQPRLFCIGHYPEILVLDPTDLYVLMKLVSRVEQNWLSALCLVRLHPNRPDVCVGLSQAGMVKIWMIADGATLSRVATQPIYEDESKQIRCEGARALVACANNPRTMLVIGTGQARVHDASDFSELLSIQSPDGTACWSGGAFYAVDKVALHCDDGTTWLYQLPACRLKGKAATALNDKNAAAVIVGNDALCFAILSPMNRQTALSRLRYCFSSDTTPTNRRYVLRASSDGQLDMWLVPSVADKSIAALQQQRFGDYPQVHSTCSTSLDNSWKNLEREPASIAGHLPDWKAVRVTLYVSTNGRLFLGRDDGAILMISAPQTIARQLLDVTPLKRCHDWPMYKLLHAHQAAVTALLYPFEYSSRYEHMHFLSGGDDFCVILWDLNTCTPLHKFTVQAGPIITLTVPPEHCSSRVGACVCSVSHDHSVALLSLKELKCVLLASRHQMPVERIMWRPFDDAMLVLCSDKTLYVWQMETGMLDRVVSGLLAEEIVTCSREMTRQWLEESVTGSATAGGVTTGVGDARGPTVSVQMLRALRHRNIDAIKSIAAETVNAGDINITDAIEIALGAPMHVQGMHTRTDDPQSHLVVINVEALIYGLLGNEQNEGDAGASSTTSENPTVDGAMRLEDAHHTQSLSSILQRAKEHADKVLQASPKEQRRERSRSRGHSVRTAAELAEGNTLCIDIAHLLLSCIHAWLADTSLDKLCAKRLGLLRPLSALCFGLVSRHGHVSVLLPSAVEPRPNKQDLVNGAPAPDADHFSWFAKSKHWRIAPTMTTQHVQAVVALAETMKSLTAASFLPEHDSKRRILRRLSSQTQNMPPTAKSQSAIDQLHVESDQLKQGWEFVGTLHFSMLHELIPDYMSPRIELLSRRWQDRCIELRVAARALLLKELKRIGADGRRGLITEWAPFLPSIVAVSLPDVSVFSTNTGPTVGATVTAVPVQVQGDELTKHGPNAMAVTPIESVTIVHGDAGVHELRRRQATALVLLAVIGSEYPDELGQCANAARPTNLANEAALKGDDWLQRHIGQSLSQLLLTPSTPLLPQYSPLRRAGIDLLGRGFCVWQPYVDINKVLLGMLELCANSDRLPLSTQPLSTPLAPPDDACRAAHEALKCIACARPAATIIALSTEVARYNAAAHSQTIQHVASASTIVRARHEVIKLIELLAEQRAVDIAELMVPLSDVIVHTLDTTLLKARTLQEVLPCLAKFRMIDYNSSSKRLIAGGKNGTVVIHELRANKAQSINAHTKSVIAVALSDDGKHLATYSAEEAKVNFFQTSSSFLGMGSSHVKPLKSVPAPDMTSETATSVYRSRLVWTSNKSVTLMQPNGREMKETRFPL